MPSVTRRLTTAPRGDASDARILAAATTLLAEGTPYTEIGIGQVVAKAGVARSTFYAHFRDKSALLLRLAGDLGDPVLHLLGGWDPGHVDSRGELAELTLAVLRYYRLNAHILGAVAEVASYDPPVRAFWDAQLEALIARGRDWVTAEQAAGRTDPLVRADTVCRIFVVGGMQTIAHQVATGSADDDEAVAQEIADAQWYGVFRRRGED